MALTVHPSSLMEEEEPSAVAKASTGMNVTPEINNTESSAIIQDDNSTSTKNQEEQEERESFKDDVYDELFSCHDGSHVQIAVPSFSSSSFS